MATQYFCPAPLNATGEYTLACHSPFDYDAMEARQVARRRALGLPDDATDEAVEIAEGTLPYTFTTRDPAQLPASFPFVRRHLLDAMKSHVVLADCTVVQSGTSVSIVDNPYLIRWQHTGDVVAHTLAELTASCERLASQAAKARAGKPKVVGCVACQSAVGRLCLACRNIVDGVTEDGPVHISRHVREELDAVKQAVGRTHRDGQSAPSVRYDPEDPQSIEGYHFVWDVDDCLVVYQTTVSGEPVPRTARTVRWGEEPSGWLAGEMHRDAREHADRLLSERKKAVPVPVRVLCGSKSERTPLPDGWTWNDDTPCAARSGGRYLCLETVPGSWYLGQIMESDKSPYPPAVRSALIREAVRLGLVCHESEPQAPEGYVFHRNEYTGAVYVTRTDHARVFQGRSADEGYYPIGHENAPGNACPHRWAGHEPARQWAAHLLGEVAPPLRTSAAQAPDGYVFDRVSETEVAVAVRGGNAWAHVHSNNSSPHPGTWLAKPEHRPVFDCAKRMLQGGTDAE